MNVFSLLLSLVLVAATPVQRIHDDIVWHVPVNEKMVAITFDDATRYVIYT